jgi:DNA-binding transcriptional LysR family regulator
MDITLRQLEIFIEVAKTKNLRLASKNLIMSHSAISMALAALEQYSGGKLFDRHLKRLSINARGTYLLENIGPLIAELKDHVQLLKNDTPFGPLRIGASTTIGNYLLPTLIGTFTPLFETPLQLDIVTENTASIENKMVNGDLDVALVEGPITQLQHLSVSRWIRDELVIVSAKPDSKITRSLRSLSDRPWVLRELGSGTRTVFESFLRAKKISLSHTLTMGPTEAVKQAAKAGLGMSCLSRLSVQQDLDHQMLYVVPVVEKIYRDFSIVIPKGRYQPVVVRRFLAHLTNPDSGDYLPTFSI